MDRMKQEIADRELILAQRMLIAYVLKSDEALALERSPSG